MSNTQRSIERSCFSLCTSTRGARNPKAFSRSIHTAGRPFMSPLPLRIFLATLRMSKTHKWWSSGLGSPLTLWSVLQISWIKFLTTFLEHGPAICSTSIVVHRVSSKQQCHSSCQSTSSQLCYRRTWSRFRFRCSEWGSLHWPTSHARFWSTWSTNSSSPWWSSDREHCFQHHQYDKFPVFSTYYQFCWPNIAWLDYCLWISPRFFLHVTDS